MRCEGCMTPGALPFDGGTLTTIADLAGEILATQGIEGLTISGGEPFAQAGALASLIRMLRERADLGMILYTGYRLDQLRRRPRSDAGVHELLEQIDLLVHGPFLPTRNDDAALRGSDNQMVALLTERYAAQRSLYQSGARRSVEVLVQAGQCMLVGIPSAAQLHWWHGLRHRDRRQFSADRWPRLRRD
jgi:anaerobic ribonucleoside-triphosphate reductase activating protein